MDGDQKPYMIIIEGTKFYFTEQQHAELEFNINTQCCTNNKQVDLYSWSDGVYTQIRTNN